MNLFNFGMNSMTSNAPPSFYNKAAEKQERLLGYQKSWEAYLADLPDPIINDNPDIDDNVKVNPARALINTSVYFLFGNKVEFQVSPEIAKNYGDSYVSESDESGIEVSPDWLVDLQRVWKANKKESFLYNLGLSGAINGDVFIKIIPNAAGMNNEFPRLMSLDPANVDVEWDPNDCSKILEYDIEYTTEDADGQPYIKTQEIVAVMDANEVIQSWTMTDYEQRMLFVNNAGWVPAEGERVQVGAAETWPYPWAPIFHSQNIELPHMFWGMPDLDDASVELIKSLQRAMSSVNKVIRVHGSPRMFAQGVMPDQIDDIDVSADNIITLPNMDANLSVLQTLNAISPSTDFTDKLKEDLYEMLQVPPIAMGKFENSKSALSGLTLAILYAPLIQKTELKRISYGNLLEAVNMAILTLMGHVNYDQYDGLVTVWPESMPGSVYLERQTLQQDQAMGASTYTVLSRLGYDPVEEQARKSAEQEAQMQLQQKYAPAPEVPGSNAKSTTPDGKPTKPGGNKNPAGMGNKKGSLGGANSAGSEKTPKNQ